MDVINLHHPFNETNVNVEPVVLAMGFFDGVHAGHREVIATAKRKADQLGVKLAVLTYDQHASVVFTAHDTPLAYLTTLPRKLALLAELGVDKTFVVNFTSKLAALSPEEFVDQYMVGLGAVAVVAGFDHTYGVHDVANMQTLPGYAKGRFEVIEVSPVYFNGHESASTVARQLVDRGQVDELADLLTIPYETTGVVVHGEARGSEMGYPTANIETTPGERLPGIGVYVVELLVGGDWTKGMASIGYNVTFGDNRPKTVEINLFDFSEQIYGEHVTVRWHHYLRGEVKFTGMAPLIAQLEADEQASRAYFEKE